MKTMLNQILRGLMRKHEDTGWVNLPAKAGWDSWNMKRRRRGDVVELMFEGVKSSPIGKEYVNIGTLPEGFRIGVNAYFIAYSETLVCLNPNGGISVRGLNENTRNLIFHKTYVAQN